MPNLFTLPFCQRLAGLTFHRLLSFGIIGIFFTAFLAAVLGALSAALFHSAYKRKPASASKSMLSVLGILSALAALSLAAFSILLIITALFGPRLYNLLFGLFGCI